MKKDKKIKNNDKKLDKGQVFVKIMAGILALMMVFSVCATLIYSLI